MKLMNEATHRARPVLRWVRGVCLLFMVAYAVIALGFALFARHPILPVLTCWGIAGCFGLIYWAVGR